MTATAVFTLCASFTLLCEDGPLSNGAPHETPGDPGGLTVWGIAINRHPELTRDQLLAMKEPDALSFYRANYWDAVRGDYLPFPLAAVVFDCAVNQGAGAAVELLQRVLGVKVDGRIGAETLAAVARQKGNAGELVAEFLAQRALAYASDAGFQQNGHGWFRRLFLAQAFGLANDRPPGG